MAPPRHRFGAHDGSPFLAAHVNERCKSLGEPLGLHVIRVAPEALVAPAGVRRILARMAQTTERRQGSVFDIVCLQHTAERIAVKLRVMTRTRHRANVSDACN